MAEANTVRVVPQPKRLKTPLYPHQRANIYTMEQLEKNKRSTLPDGSDLESVIGILGDRVGTGKTKTIIGLICRDKMPWKEPLHHSASQTCSNLDGSIRIIKRDVFTRISTTLIVVPPSIVGQWENELKETDLSFKTIERKSECRDVEAFEVAICCTTMYNHLMTLYKDVVFKRFVFDEMDSAHIPNMAHIRAGHLWFVSATFSSVLATINRSRKVHFLKQLFMNILSSVYTADEILNAITVKSTSALRNLTPIPLDFKTIDYEDVPVVPVVRELRRYMDADLVSMINSGNIKGAIQHLGGSEQQCNIADLVRARAKKTLDEAEHKMNSYTGRQKVEWTAKFEAAKRQFENIEERINGMYQEDCTYCAEPLKNVTLYTCCQNISCARCVACWLPKNKTCPTCRFPNPSIVYLPNHNRDGEESLKEEKGGEEPEKDIRIGRTKFDILENIISRGKKILVFAEHDDIFRQIATLLDGKGVRFDLVKGTANQREKIIHNYTNGDTKVLILNSRKNGAGINLQCTTDIVLWHEMPEDIRRQAIGRALRYGLKHALTVHNLFKKDDLANAEGDEEEEGI